MAEPHAANLVEPSSTMSSSSSSPPSNSGAAEAEAPTSAERLARFEVPIRREFLRTVVVPDKSPVDAATPTDRRDKRRSEGDAPQQPHAKRPKHHHSVPFATGFCKAVARNEPCPRGDSCKFSHDSAEYLRNKQPDIGPECYNYRVRGRCPAGIECRFAGDHTVDGHSIENAEVAQRYQPELNALSIEMQGLLRRRAYPFKLSPAMVKKFAPPPSGQAGRPHDEDASTLPTAVVTTEGDTAPATTAPESEHANSSSSSSSTTTNYDADATIESTSSLKATLLSTDSPKKVDFRDKVILAPLTTIGNLPFRRLCKRYGADITISEMALSHQLLQASKQEWALMQRHPSEDIFGIQLAGAHVDQFCPAAELLRDLVQHDFIDVNCGCPTDLVCNKGFCAALLDRPRRMEDICRSMKAVMEVPLTLKMRMGTDDKKPIAHRLIPQMGKWGLSAVTIHGRSKKQRYTKRADWQYIGECVKAAQIPVIGNGDIYSWEEARDVKASSGVDSLLLARGAIIKPWLFTEIKEQRHWDITATERLEMLKDFTNFGLEHWGSDERGVATVRQFLLEWLSFLYRYVPIGLVEHLPVLLNHRPPAYFGRTDLETLLSSEQSSDWIKISEILLGKVPDGFRFVPKHAANAYTDNVAPYTIAITSPATYQPTSVLADASR